MSNDIQEINDNTLDEFIKRLEKIVNKDENEIEFWYARDLQKILEYDKWENFKKVLEKAQISCNEFGENISSHWLPSIRKSISGKGKQEEIEDFKLTRYACYLIAQNADVRKKIVAFAQTYFAVQTRRQEINDSNLEQLNEDEKRIMLRNDIKSYNKKLSGLARQAGVVKPYDFGNFQDAGYKGLYGGLKENDLHLKRGLSEKEHILDHMGSEELGANIFRITQATAKMTREKVSNKKDANKIHEEAGEIARSAIAKMGNTMPEELPTAENIKNAIKRQKQIEKENKKKAIKN